MKTGTQVAIGLAIAAPLGALMIAATTSTSETPNGSAREVAPAISAAPAVKEKPKMTPGQANALQAGQNYVDFAPFSRKGLVRQLTSEYGDKYDHKDAVYAADHVKANWKAEAVEAAKNYLDFQAFSRDGLIQQLTSNYGDQFTHEQAVHAVNKVGL